MDDPSLPHAVEDQWRISVPFWIPAFAGMTAMQGDDGNARGRRQPAGRRRFVAVQCLNALVFPRINLNCLSGVGLTFDEPLETETCSLSRCLEAAGRISPMGN